MRAIQLSGFGLGDCGCGGEAPAPAAPAAQSFATSAATAMEAAPDYFVWWYSAKSLLLVAVTAALAYQLGKSSR